MVPACSSFDDAHQSLLGMLHSALSSVSNLTTHLTQQIAIICVASIGCPVKMKKILMCCVLSSILYHGGMEHATPLLNVNRENQPQACTGNIALEVNITYISYHI